jgi:hypothetical protein
VATRTDFSLRLHEDDHRLRLEEWRRNVGAPVALDQAPAADGRAGSIVVLGWNVWIGRGRLREMITRIRSGAYAAQGADPDLRRRPIAATLLFRQHRLDRPAGYWLRSSECRRMWSKRRRR